MLKEWKARKPNYFFVVFGESYASEHPVYGGVYPDHKKWTRLRNLGMAPGDVLLLYCGKDSLDLGQEAPGVGIVIGVETVDEAETIYYQYFPLDKTVPWDPVIKELAAVKKHPGLHLMGNWVFDLPRKEFNTALAGRRIDWQ